jgi:hypothetical protein
MVRVLLAYGDDPDGEIFEEFDDQGEHYHYQDRKTVYDGKCQTSDYRGFIAPRHLKARTQPEMSKADRDRSLRRALQAGRHKSRVWVKR